MGQEEIIEFLQAQRASGDESFFSIREIAKGINGGSPHYHAIRRSLYALVRLKVVDSKAEGDIFDWIRTFRIADKQMKGDK